MVDVAEHGHDRRPLPELGGVLPGQREQLAAGRGDDPALLARLHGDHVLGGDRLDLEAEVVRDDLGRAVVDHLVLGRHDVALHELLDDLGVADLKPLGEVLDRDGRR